MSEASKRANKKWNKNNMCTLGCTVRKEIAEEFKNFCKEKNSSVHTELKNFVEKTIAGE